VARFRYDVMLAWLKQCFCKELTVHKASSFKTIPPRIDYETPSEAAICLHEAGHSTAALMVGLAQELTVADWRIAE
jgi:hypothetical protein